MKDFADLQTKATRLSEAVETRRTELQGLINERDDAVKKLTGSITRAKSAFKGFFGPDSSQYDQAGGKSASARKSPKRKAKATAS